MAMISSEEKTLLDTLNKAGFDETPVGKIMGNTSKSLYRLNVLDQVAVKNIVKADTQNLPNTLLTLTYLIHSSIKACAFPNCKDFTPTVTGTKKNSKYDYQNCDSMKISKNFNESVVKMTPIEISNEIIKNIPKNSLIETIEITGPGFLNIIINPLYAAEFANTIITHGVLPPFVEKRRTIVDFSSPNIAKEMHVGHLRSTIIGESISRILEYINFDVLRFNHIGDWGTQFGMLIAHLEDQFPNYLVESPPISDLQKFYKQSKARFDSDEVFKKRAYTKVVALQQGDQAVRSAWKLICDISRKDFQNIYSRLDVTIEEMGESFYQSRMMDIINELKTSNKLAFEDGCSVMHIPGMEVPLLVVKSDGGFTYDTSDMATIRYRLLERKADWILYVVDSGQRDHFNTLFKFSEIMHWSDPTFNRIEHIGFGVVLGEDGKKFKTRSGETIKLTALLDESVSRYRAKLMERGSDKLFSEEELKQISETIGYACIKYADLSKNLQSTYEFSFDRMLDDKGNTAVYLMYIYTRIRSIIRKSEKTDTEIVEYIKKNPITVDNPAELKLIKKLVHFPEIIYRIVFDTYPHLLCEYLYDLSCSATEYYDACQIITPSKDQPQTVNMNRLAQIYATSLVIKKSFDLLGLQTLERM